MIMLDWSVEICLDFMQLKSHTKDKKVELSWLGLIIDPVE